MQISRRELLGGLVGAGGLWLAGGRARASEPAEAMIVRAARPHDLETPRALLDDEFTPNDRFFVRSHFGPALLRELRLEIGGRVRRPLTLRLDELRKLPRVTVAAVLQCAGNGRALFRPRVPGAQWERGAVGQARWTGVRLGDLLARAGVDPAARFVRLEGGDRPPLPTVPAFARSIPLDKAARDVVLAYEMNGEPLPLLHGAPLRAIVPGWVGDDWVKWLRSVRVETEEDAGFYMKTGYRLDGKPMTSLVVKSIITRPAGALAAAPTVIAGFAFAGERSVRSVDVSLDGGRSWQAARLDPPRGLGAWQRWQLPWTPAAGRHRLVCRATDDGGATQPERPAWNAGGYLWNGWDDVTVEVRA